MESQDFEALQRTAERAESAPWVEYPPTPPWYPLAIGAYAGLVTFGLGDLGSVASAVALATATLAVLVFVGWYRRYRGTGPTGAPPSEMRRPMVVVGIGLATSVTVVALLTWLLPTWVGVVAALVLNTTLAWSYERAYAAGAAAARERLR